MFSPSFLLLPMFASSERRSTLGHTAIPSDLCSADTCVLHLYDSKYPAVVCVQKAGVSFVSIRYGRTNRVLGEAFSQLWWGTPHSSNLCIGLVLERVLSWAIDFPAAKSAEFDIV